MFRPGDTLRAKRRFAPKGITKYNCPHGTTDFSQSLELTPRFRDPPWRRGCLVRRGANGIYFAHEHAAEIEKAAEALSREEQEALMRFLAVRIPRAAGSIPRDGRVFPLSRGREVFGSEEVARIETEVR